MFEEKKAAWLQKAEELKPELIRETVRPVSGMPGRALTENESIVLDFGNHYVGRLTLKLGSEGSHHDAPAWLQVKFCENSRERAGSSRNRCISMSCPPKWHCPGVMPSATSGLTCLRCPPGTAWWWRTLLPKP